MPSRADAWSDRITTPYVWLAKITHPLLDEPIRVAVDSADVTYGGETYAAGSFSLVAPNFTEGNQNAKIRVANIDRRAGLAIAGMFTPAQAVFSLVNADDPDTGAAQWPPMLISSAVGNSVEITGEFRSLVNPQDSWPKERADKLTAPALFL